MDDSFDLCLVGAGNMGGAMLQGWLQSGFSADRIMVVDPAPRAGMAEMIARNGVRHEMKPPGHYQPDVLLIAVKPQMMDAVLPTLAPLAGSHTLCMSVAAGTTIARMARDLGDVAIVRCMPNTPSLVGRGMTACHANARVSEQQRDRVEGLLNAIGKSCWVETEAQIDAVTAVSGSGPAYVFHLAECMAAAGIAEGLPEEVANLLARETIAGAGEMLSRQADSAAQLRQNVTSPNGTTAAALGVLMKDGAMEKLLARAIHAARKRSEELSG